MLPYRGRFAPSPTGPLHFGSLFAAVISYLDAYSNQGEWLIRVEDIDPLREQKGATKAIIETLDCHGLLSDSTIVYQSTRSALYQNTLNQLQHSNFAYACPCSRKYLLDNNGHHSPSCESQSVNRAQCAIKFRTQHNFHQDQFCSWHDQLQGTQSRHLTEDFVLKRKEGFFAYQLAVVCDDLEQNITHVVRGYDLLESTPMQLAIYNALKKSPPVFAHFPIIAYQNGQKLSKQNKAPAINNKQSLNNLLEVFSLLGITLKNRPSNCKNALKEALDIWNPQFLYEKRELILNSPL